MIDLPPITEDNVRRVRLRAIMEREHSSISAACRAIGWHFVKGSKVTMPTGVGKLTRPLDPADLVAALRALCVEPEAIFRPILIEGDLAFLRWVGEEFPTSDEAMTRARCLGGRWSQPDQHIYRLYVQGLIRAEGDRFALTAKGEAAVAGADIPEPSLRDLRLQAGLTQSMCALYAGVTRQAWSSYEGGRIKVDPKKRSELVEAIEKALASEAASST